MPEEMRQQLLRAERGWSCLAAHCSSSRETALNSSWQIGQIDGKAGIRAMTLISNWYPPSQLTPSAVQLG